jgi:hypothetical protein
VSIYQLKPLSTAAVPAALEKAERYRLLNEPGEAVSICEDVLLALTDQLLDAPAVASKAEQVARSLSDEYDRFYYQGIIAERTAKAHLRRGGMSPEGVYEWIADAMECYERAEALRPAGNDDAILRWNACARLLKENPNLRPAVDDRREPQFLE